MKNYDQKQSSTGVLQITRSQNFYEIPKKASALELFIKKGSGLRDSFCFEVLSFQNSFFLISTMGESLCMTTN